MTTDKDSRLVEYLYDEMTDEEADAFERALESDQALSAEVEELDDTLRALRSVEGEEPPGHLDALILASAREAAEGFEEEADKRGLRGWLRKMFGSPIAGLIGAASVALIAAIVMVPTMLTQKSVPADMEMEGVPPPAIVAKQEATRAPAPEEAPVSRTETDLAPRMAAEPDPAPPPKAIIAGKPKRKARARPRPARRLEKKMPAKSDAPRTSRRHRARTVFSDDGLAGGDAKDQLAEGRPAGGSGPAAPRAPTPRPQRPVDEAKEAPKVASAAEPLEDALEPPAPPAELEADRAETQIREAEERQASKAEEKAQSVAAKEERGRAMLAAARQEFARKNPTSGRAILVRALALTGGAPVHAEIAFRLAQHDYDRGAYTDAIRHGRIAASAPKFDKRSAALDLVVAAEKKLRSQREQMDRNLAPAASPDSDVVR